jgi:hypothetical protein
MARTITDKCCSYPLIGNPLRGLIAQTAAWRNSARNWVPVPFVIFGQPRCGTNALTVFLDHQPSVICHREIVEGIDAFSDKESVERPDTRDAPEYWNWLYRARPDVRAVGWKYLNVQNPAFRDAMLKDGSIRKLLLLRKNKFRQVLSNRLSTRHNQWRAKSKEQLDSWKSRREPIALEPTSLLGEMNYYIKEEIRMRDQLSQRSAPFMELAYEECFGRRGSVVRIEILKFLRLPPDSSAGAAVDEQMNPEPWHELIANSDEVEHAFSQTPHRWMLD